MQVKKKWADDMAAVLQRTAEGLLNTREDWLTNLITQQIIEGATKIMLVGIAKTVGTAGTGTAISTLSGAASKSAVFAWFGIGSASLGSFVVLPVLTTGGSWLCGRLLYGAERTRKELNKKEKAMFDDCRGYSAILLGKTKGKKYRLQLTKRNIDALRILQKNIGNYWRYGCRKHSHVRSRTKNNHAEMSKLLDSLG